MEKAAFSLAVVMQKRATSSQRWQADVWEPLGIVPGYQQADGDTPRQLVDDADAAQWLYPGFGLQLKRDEAEGYYLNVSSPEPSVFIMWRMEEGKGVPQYVTVSYDEASRWMDGGEQVDRVRMPRELFAWVGEWVEKNYRPEPKKRVKPRSFVNPKDRVG